MYPRWTEWWTHNPKKHRIHHRTQAWACAFFFVFEQHFHDHYFHPIIYYPSFLPPPPKTILSPLYNIYQRHFFPTVCCCGVTAYWVNSNSLTHVHTQGVCRRRRRCRCRRRVCWTCIQIYTYRRQRNPCIDPIFLDEPNAQEIKTWEGSDQTCVGPTNIRVYGVYDYWIRTCTVLRVRSNLEEGFFCPSHTTSTLQ